METHPERIQNGIARADGSVTPFNAGDAVPAAVALCRESRILLPPQIKARLGKGAKALLDSEYPPAIVVSACVAAIRTGWYGSVESIGLDMLVAQEGQRVTRTEYQQALDQTSVRIQKFDSPVWKALRDDAQRRAERTKS